MNVLQPQKLFFSLFQLCDTKGSWTLRHLCWSQLVFVGYLWPYLTMRGWIKVRSLVSVKTWVRVLGLKYTSAEAISCHRFIPTKALLLFIYTLRPYRHHRLMRAGKIRKQNRSTDKEVEKYKCTHLCLWLITQGCSFGESCCKCTKRGGGVVSEDQFVGLKVKWYVATDCTHCTQ